MLAVNDLRLAYSKRHEELFDGLNYHFTPAAITAVTGRSGRGKSSLMYVLGLMLRPTGGDVTLDGVVASDLGDTARSQVRARTIGFIFQDAALDPARTVLDGVVEPALYAGLPRRVAVRRAHELLERFDVAHRATHRPGQISGGQAQRVAICRAMVNDPSVVLADEPTGNLDRENAAAVLRALRAGAREGRTVVIATHDPFVLEHADAELHL